MADTKLRKLEPVRIFEQAVEQIRDLILGGVFASEERLPTEQELGKQLNVSRSSVREALRVLEAEGLIEVRRGTGAFVAATPFKGGLRGEYMRWIANRKESLEQLLQVRESVEGLTAALLASYASDKIIENLREIVDAQASLINETGVDPDREEIIDELARLDAEFHLAISSASGNDIAHEIISHIISAYNQSNKAVIYVGRRQRKMEQEHRLIFNAIVARDSRGAEEAMRAHIARVRSEIRSSKSE